MKSSPTSIPLQPQSPVNNGGHTPPGLLQQLLNGTIKKIKL